VVGVKQKMVLLLFVFGVPSLVTSQKLNFPISIPPGSIPPKIVGVKCSMFKTHDDAQRYYLYWKSKGQTPKKLDADKDGSACDCLPGGPKYGTKSCNRSR
jgi:hypothetical protein